MGTVQGLMTAVIAESLHDNPEVASADASLVSAAPELLEALDRISKQFDHEIGVEHVDEYYPDARKAIAKAKGKTK